MLQDGQPFPQFELPMHDGGTIRLTDYIGSKPVVLYFYPKASTSGCTKESIAFTELYPQFTKLSAEVFGVSADSAKAQTNFCEKYSLRVGGLLTDKDWTLLTEVGLPFDKGKAIKRQTFVIDKDGKLAMRYYYTGRGDPSDHARLALEAVEKLTIEQSSVS